MGMWDSRILETPINQLHFDFAEHAKYVDYWAKYQINGGANLLKLWKPILRLPKRDGPHLLAVLRQLDTQMFTARSQQFG